MKKDFVDASVLIAALWSGHEAHERCRGWLKQAKNGRIVACTSQHAILETYAVLTGLPVSPRLSPAAVRSALRTLSEFIQTLPTPAGAYEAVLNSADRMGISGGAAYDLLHFTVAVDGHAERIVTLNPKDFQRFLGPEQIEVAGI